MRGDPLTRKSKEEYVAGCEEHRVAINRHTAIVQLDRLREQLPLCVTAEQGVVALTALIDFLETEVVARARGKHEYKGERNLRKVDVTALRKQVRWTKLPFEYLVRSVWEEGPEVEYDRVKLSLETLLDTEIARRKQIEAAAKKRAAAAKEAADSKVKPRRVQSAPKARVGLLTFYGHLYERPPPPKWWE